MSTTTTYEPTSTLWACSDCACIECYGADYMPWASVVISDYWEKRAAHAGDVDHYTFGGLDTDVGREDRGLIGCELCGRVYVGDAYAFTGWVPIA